MLKIRDLLISKPYCLAPLAGVITVPFRKMIDRIGDCAVLFTELISAAAIVRHNKKTYELIEDKELETPLFLQLFGHRPEAFLQAIELFSKDFRFAGIDINCGCPVRRVVKNNCGAALLDQPEILVKIVAACRPAVKIPLTVKVRLGYKKTDLLELLKKLEGCGVDAVTVHFRFQNQGYGSPADWSWAEKIKSAVSIPVIGNGDLFTVADVRSKEALVDGLMIGRGAVANPFIFNQLQNKEITNEMRRSFLLGLLDCYLNHYRHEQLALCKLKAVFSYLNFENIISRKDKKDIFLAQNWQQLSVAVNNLIERKLND